MVWLLWVHHERSSFIGFQSYFTLLSTTASIIQQIHQMGWWSDIKTAEYNQQKAADAASRSPIGLDLIGLDLGLFWIQYYSYNVEALLTLFWAGALAHSIYGFADIASFKAIRHKTNAAAKVVAIVLPAILISLLSVDSVKSNVVAFLVLANINMLLSLTLGAILLLAILGRYIHTRRQFLSWNVPYGHSTGTGTGVGSQYPSRSGATTRRPRSIYDRWLMIRFSITFVMLGIFELFLILFQVSSVRNNLTAQVAESPDLSAPKAIADTLTFIPGCCPSILLFIVFGTTGPFRAYMRKTFLPKRFHKDTTQIDQSRPTPSSSQIPKTLNPSVHTEEGPPTPSEDGYIITLREINIRNSHIKPDDEWPILTTTTRVNGASV
ncbi:hypothetical protein JX266_011070 [Neoarthrinium moseri]|nr:hypothetical protein JX266_011070 [Neoarthrinium moseri]